MRIVRGGGDTVRPSLELVSPAAASRRRVGVSRSAGPRTGGSRGCSPSTAGNPPRI